MSNLEFKVGDTLIYSEMGNMGKVQVLAIERRNAPSPDGQDNWMTRVRLRALEKLDGSRIVRPIEAGEEWESTKSDESGHYAGWFLRTEANQILL